MNTLMTTLEKEAYGVVCQAEEPSCLWQDVIALAEQGALKAALDLCAGNQTEAAELLGMNRATLRSRVERYQLRGYGGKLQGSLLRS